MGGAIASPSSRRAWIEITSTHTGMVSSLVALLAEGVDRNTSGVSAVVDWFVALLAEGVDRNKLTRPGAELERASPSSRRAWIEINIHVATYASEGGSPSSRRAWIEMLLA